MHLTVCNLTVSGIPLSSTQNSYLIGEEHRIRGRRDHGQVDRALTQRMEDGEREDEVAQRARSPHDGGIDSRIEVHDERL